MKINGHPVVGQEISYSDGYLTVDGRPFKDPNRSGPGQTLNIVITGNVKGGVALPRGNIEVQGNVDWVETSQGNVEVSKNVKGSVNTFSGSVTVSGSVRGSVSTHSGPITCTRAPAPKRKRTTKKADDDKKKSRPKKKARREPLITRIVS
jgi:hypothetical protein